MGPGKEKIQALEKKMADLGINKQDIEEKFIKSSGRGGQKVNKTSSTVYLKHLPTDIEVKCGKTRSREDNRFFAKRILAEKIQEALTGSSRRLKMIERIRKQKNKRRKRAVSKTMNNEL